MSHKKIADAANRTVSPSEQANGEPPSQTELFAPSNRRTAPAARRRSVAASSAPAKASRSRTATPIASNVPHASPAQEPRPELVVRDTFSMPPDEHGYIEMLRVRAAREGRNTTKSEVIRAGLISLAGLKPAQLVKLLEGLEKVKPGRR